MILTIIIIAKLKERYFVEGVKTSENSLSFKSA